MIDLIEYNVHNNKIHLKLNYGNYIMDIDICLIDNDGYKPIINQYTITELKRDIKDQSKEIANRFNNISVTGTLQGLNIWKRGGCNFKIVDNSETIECKAYQRNIGNISSITSYIDKVCTLYGFITVDTFNKIGFVFLVRSIQCKSNESDIYRLKEYCTLNDFYKNKKDILWDQIKCITLISKSGTQGYNDFKKQINIPLNIKEVDITLEGLNTEEELIQSIKGNQDSDAIIILRAGGSTVDISNSFDKLEIFKCIKESKIPIITAIGHENDKGDNLLITEISDLNFDTPSSAALLINLWYKDYIIERITWNKGIIKEKIDTKIKMDETEYYSKLYNENKKRKDEEVTYKRGIKNDLKNIISQIKEDLFGGRSIQLDDKEEYICIHINNDFFKIPIHNLINKVYKIDIDPDIYQSSKNIEQLIYNDKVIEAYNEMEKVIISMEYTNVDTTKLRESIESCIIREKSINRIDSIIQNRQYNNLQSLVELDEDVVSKLIELDDNKRSMIQIKSNKHLNFYCNNLIQINSLSIIQLIELYSMYLWYEENIHIKEVFNYCMGLSMD